MRDVPKSNRLPRPDRRQFLKFIAASGLAAWLCPGISAAQNDAVARRPIPSTGETIPVIGLGSWITFNVGNDPIARDACAAVMDHFFSAGGRMIDSSPMYGSSQEVIGYGLKKMGRTKRVFSADKVWTIFGQDGARQVETSRSHWNIPRFDLMQVHNLVDWENQLPMLFDKKAAGEIRYVGITTSESRRHDFFEKIMRSQPLDFVQFSYNIRNRQAEERLLPLALDRGIAVIANRPFQQSALIDWISRYPLPPWAADIECANWAQVLLKFIVSHPAVTCAIPATTRVDHVLENMGAARGQMPDSAMRRKMVETVEQL